MNEPLIDKSVQNENENKQIVNEKTKAFSEGSRFSDKIFTYKSYIKSFRLNYNKRNNNHLYFTLAMFYILSAFFYKKSLKGGDLNFYTKSTLVVFARFISISFISYNMNLWLIAFMNTSIKKKIILYIFHVLLLAGFYIYDHGELLDNHGLYNFILFCMYIIIFNSIAVSLYFWRKYSGKKGFIFQFTTFILIFILVQSINLKKYINIWGNGLLDKKLEDYDNLCKIDKPIPWFDLLPKGAKNFWTGFSSCSRKETFEAFFDHTKGNKFVVQGCSENEITYMILPETRNLKYKEKTRWKLRKAVVNRMKSKTYNYTEPVDLKNVEAVYVTCGIKQIGY
eukprot:jgi/Orpsp1_1/1174094/evm.model.c7180000048882.2